MADLNRGDDIRHEDGRTARVVAVESHYVHARLWVDGWPFPGLLVTWKRSEVERISRPTYDEPALL